MANFLRPETVSPPGKKELPNIQEDEEKKYEANEATKNQEAQEVKIHKVIYYVRKCWVRRDNLVRGLQTGTWLCWAGYGELTGSPG